MYKIERDATNAFNVYPVHGITLLATAQWNLPNAAAVDQTLSAFVGVPFDWIKLTPTAWIAHADWSAGAAAPARAALADAKPGPVAATPTDIVTSSGDDVDDDEEAEFGSLFD